MLMNVLKLLKSFGYHFLAGCQPFGPMGMANGTIKESQLSASSLSKTSADQAGHGPYLAGLGSELFWSQAAGSASMDKEQYLQVDFRQTVDIRMVSQPQVIVINP